MTRLDQESNRVSFNGAPAMAIFDLESRPQQMGKGITLSKKNSKFVDALKTDRESSVSVFFYFSEK